MGHLFTNSKYSFFLNTRQVSWIFGDSLLDSMTLMYLRITFAQYLVFNDYITPWFIGCVTEVVFGGKNWDIWLSNQAHVDGQDNYQIQVLLNDCEPEIFDLAVWSILWRILNPSNSFVVPCTCMVKTVLKYLGFLHFPMKSSGSFSP